MKNVVLRVSVMAVLCGVAACTQGIGDGCETALRCSAAGTRLCDMTQPGGYCTLAGCQGSSCPPEAVCVTFWQSTREGDADRNRLSSNFCMRKCDERSDCRDDDGYDCLAGKDFGDNGEASVEPNPNQKFCAVRLPHAPMFTSPDAGMSSSM
jgi:hypothetical protein